MKKLALLGLLILLFFFLAVDHIQAWHRHCSTSDTFLTFSCFQKPKGVGLKQRLFDNVYATGSLDNRSTVQDLEFQAGALYVFPQKIIIFQFYGGAGIQFSRNLGYQYPYITLGTNFLFFFTEVIHPLEREMESRYRFGLSFKF